ncbi:TPMT family class I SAM-dependent methyltransferase [Roseateles oligotrophus]|uniref:TPMT family class I SAM-dependent methyltransferase n=1 Tax=Roseateles oligotrophus TaxID=1769250 RepID=A0ABT2YHF6_9BURK|nr:TPMT family class I SAM-dependent methyltransferase [Roseateles oligotrophus]MCV2369489.1 TPMT family class I SAM-dependent methyltransferase [Roseateles oligotrophus]
MAGPTQEFWQQRFVSGQIPWDRGEAQPQLKQWLAQGLITPGQSLLVPGCGRGHELLLLAKAGVKVLGLDYAPAAVDLARTQLAAHDASGLARVEQANVLTWQAEAALDAIYEQTCLCALHPDHWRRYADQLHSWLKPGGRLFALLMQARRESAGVGVLEGPPYHCDIQAVRALFPIDRWDWPAPPYAAHAHAQGWTELAVVLTRR